MIDFEDDPAIELLEISAPLDENAKARNAKMQNEEVFHLWFAF